MQLNWIKIVLIMITINIVIAFSTNIYLSQIDAKDIVGEYNDDGYVEFDENANMGVLTKLLLFNNSVEGDVSDVTEDGSLVYYKTSQSFWNVVDGIVNMALFVGMFFEITLNILFTDLSIQYAQNVMEMYIISFVIFIVSIGNLLVFIKTVQLLFNKDTS